jgi:acetoacetyl-CoA synthetase
MEAADRRIMWEPPADAEPRMAAFLRGAAVRHGLPPEATALAATDPVAGYAAVHAWSVRRLDALWSAVVDEFSVRFDTPPDRVLDGERMPHVRWFPGATLNYAGHLRTVLERLAERRPEEEVLVARSQARDRIACTPVQLLEAIDRCAAGLQQLGVVRGDRVAGYLPNGPEAVIAFLATATLGAVWSSCAPEFGVPAVLDRFGQIDPVVLVGVTSSTYGSRHIDRSAELDAIRRGLPGLRATVIVPDGRSVGDDDDAAAVVTVGAGADGRPERLMWDALMDLGARAGAAPDPVPVPFDHPLYVLYSSGSTGPPKAIIHGHGGILLEHLKVLGLHHDLDERDTLLWFTTTGWMMWNLLVSGLLLGARVVLLDGDPAWPTPAALWHVVAEERCTVVGVGSVALQRHQTDGLELPADLDLRAVRQVGATGSPLAAGGFDWVAQHIGPHVQTVSISGGTDVCTAFIGANPLLPVRAGELQAPCLGCAIEAWGPDHRPRIGELGELVLTAPMPSMPIGLWGDADGALLERTYFAQHPGVWWHGDWLRVHADGGCVISGRSDATLNRGGIRSGTAEFTTIVEGLPEVRDSLIAHREVPDAGIDELVLLVALAEGIALDDDVIAAVRGAVRSGLSPRHVPDRILAVPAVPRTISGKKVEVPVKRVLCGADPRTVITPDALADPDAWRTLVTVLSRAGLVAGDAGTSEERTLDA